ncbi:hypothetical protein [uncultured Pseudomonas sp.]|uniref:hypothetical protein n=1 Tax=uncultured Pseudomonas sp. TaxID=114707 RepID=UPI002584832A|nr:hypothetical protein [uncultured Pseudomonas sp.]
MLPFCFCQVAITTTIVMTAAGAMTTAAIATIIGMTATMTIANGAAAVIDV